MGIDLSLVLTPYADPRPRDPADRVVAWARGFVPIAWWTWFEPGDAVVGPRGLALVARADAVLARLRRRATEVRAAAGRHALGLRSVEAALDAASSAFVRAELHELYGDALPDDLEELTAPGRLPVWPLTKVRGRVLSTPHHGGTLADGVVGRVATPAAPTLPDPASLPEGSLAALRAGDAAELDLLEEALATSLAPAHAPWGGLVRRRWGHGAADAAAREALQAFAAGRPDPFAPLARVHDHFAAYALSEAVGRDPALRGKLRKALRGATEPLAAVVALALGWDGSASTCPSLERLLVAGWLDGGAPPRTVDTPEAVIACRLAAVGAPEWPLSLRDPLAVAEQLLGRGSGLVTGLLHRVAPAAVPDDPALAVSRALRLPVAEARGWIADAEDPERRLATASQGVAEVLCRRAGAIETTTRAALLAAPGPEAPFLCGVDRACVRLALGDTSVLPGLLRAGTASPSAVVGALRAARAADRALAWLTDRCRAGDPSAAALVLETPTADAGAVAAARAVARTAAQRVRDAKLQLGEGVVTFEEHDAVIAEAEALAEALGPGLDAEALRVALGRAE